MRLLTLFAVTTLAWPVISSAAEPDWVAIRLSNSFTQYVDVNSLRIRAGRLTALTLTSFSAPQQSNDANIGSYLSITTLNTYDCSNHRAGSLNMTFYAEAVGKGEVLKTVTLKPIEVVMNHSPPGSLGHTQIEAVCALWAKKSHQEKPGIVKD
jgi:hypothetical protein